MSHAAPSYNSQPTTSFDVTRMIIYDASKYTGFDYCQITVEPVNI